MGVTLDENPILKILTPHLTKQFRVHQPRFGIFEQLPHVKTKQMNKQTVKWAMAEH